MARNTLGYDKPWHRDWRFWTVLITSVVGVGVGIALEGFRWQHPFQALGGVLIGGLLFGGIREAVRGFREPRGTS